MKFAAKLLLASSVLWLKSCTPCPAQDSNREIRQTREQVYRVSWEQFSERGKIGKYGIAYEPQAMTCASRKWPCGTRLRFTEIHNGLSVVVTVADVNPRGKCVADLSAAAFEKLDGLPLGIAEVTVEVLPKTNSSTETQRK